MFKILKHYFIASRTNKIQNTKQILDSLNAYFIFTQAKKKEFLELLLATKMKIH